MNHNFVHTSPLIRFAVAWIAGLCTALYVSIPNALAAGVAMAVLSFLFWRLVKKIDRIRYRTGFGVSLLLGFFLSGNAYLSAFQSEKYLHSLPEEKQVYTVVVTQPSKLTGSFTRFETEVLGYQNRNIRPVGALFYLRGHEVKVNLGDTLCIYARLSLLDTILNPYQFNLSEYRWYKGLRFQSFFNPEDIISQTSGARSIRSIGLGFRAFFEKKLEALKVGQDYLPIAKALILGDKDDLSRETTQEFAAAGAMHVLAVSGLHVGLVYGLVLLLFKRLPSTAKVRLLECVIGLTVIWCYAAITGFSASVMRASLMFSFTAIAKAIGGKGNIFNALALAALMLTAYNPYFITEVGFQLSFVAVLSIVIFQPFFARFYSPKNKLIDAAWQITCVSLAAQLGTAPLSALYFHQFPMYFLVANLLVIPLATGLLYAGVVALLLAAVGLVIRPLGNVLEATIYVLQSVTQFTQSLPHAQLGGLFFNDWECWVSYAVIGGFAAGIYFRLGKLILLSQAVVLLFVGYVVFRPLPKDGLYLLNTNKHITVVWIKKGDAYWYSTEPSRQQLDFSVGNFLERTQAKRVLENKAFYHSDSLKSTAVILSPAGETLLIDRNPEKVKEIPSVIKTSCLADFHMDTQKLSDNIGGQKQILLPTVKWYKRNWLKQRSLFPTYDISTQGALYIP